MKEDLDSIVITGVGLVSPLGLSAAQTWQAVRAGRCGIGPLDVIESPLPDGGEGGQAPQLPDDFSRQLPREARYLRFALMQAIENSDMRDASPYPLERTGIVLGTTLHGMRSLGRYFRGGGVTSLKDFLASSVLRNAATGLPMRGAAITTCSACSSSLGAVALGMSLLKAGELDCVIAGGYDTLCEYVYGGFNSLRLVAKGPLRPFTRGREGMKLAEGYGLLVLERGSQAEARGAKVVAQILGYGESSDAHHLTQPHPQGCGAARAMNAALKNAGVPAEQVDLIAAHATGTPDNDAAEFAAMNQVFGARLPEVPVVAFKSHLGHTLGGAGAVELILSAMALRDQVVPPCANLKPEQIEFAGLNIARTTAPEAPLRVTLNTSLGFGGANTCLVLGQASGQLRDRSGTAQISFTARVRSSRRPILITGIGVLLPGITGKDALAAAFSGESEYLPRTGTIDEDELAPLLNARRARRLSEYVKLSLAATTLCLRDANVADAPEFISGCAAVLGTSHGSTGYCESYYRQIVNEGISAANPMLFAEGVPNAAAAHLSLMFGIKGSCQTIIGSRTAGLDALRLASTRIAAGEWDRALVGCGEEYSEILAEVYRQSDLPPVRCAGAITLLLESEASADGRSARAYGKVLDTFGGGGSIQQLPRIIAQNVRGRRDVDGWIGSANGSWLDRVEKHTAQCARIVTPVGRIAECASVVPLAGLAAALVTGRLWAEAQENPIRVDRFGVIASDYGGFVSGAMIERGSM